MPIAALAQLKGGVGKTTLAVNLAGELAAAYGLRVVLVDADEQGSAVAWAEAGELPFSVVALPLESERGAASWAATVRRHAEDVDLVVLDTPPHVGVATKAAALVADLAVVPVGPSGVDISATARTLSLLQAARSERGDDKPVVLLIPARVDMRLGLGRELPTALKQLGKVGPSVGQRSAFPMAYNTGRTVRDYDANSKAAVEIQLLATAVRRGLKL